MCKWDLNEWVLVNSISKVSDGWIRDLGFNPCIYQKPIGVLFDDKMLLLGVDAIGWNSLKKKKDLNHISFILWQKTLWVKLNRLRI